MIAGAAKQQARRTSSIRITPHNRARRSSKTDSQLVLHGLQHRNGSPKRMSFQQEDSLLREADKQTLRGYSALSSRTDSGLGEVSFYRDSNQVDEKTRHAQMDGSMPWLSVSCNSRFRQCWDLTSLCAVLYCTFVVPFQMTFDPAQTDLLSAIDITIEVFFISEILLNFVTSYVNADGDEVRSKSLIAWNYMKTWLAIDAVSSIPTESITRIAEQMAEGSGDESGGANVDALYNLRIIRIVRLTKLLRLLRLGKLIEVIEFSFPSLGTIIGLLRLLFMMVIVAHLQACVFYYLASLNKGNSWISKYHFACCDENLNLYRAHQLEVDPECYDESLVPPLEVLYTNAIYWSFATLTTVGYGDITPCNEMEILFSIASMVIGSAMFAYIVGNISSVVTNMKGQEIKLRQRMRELQEYIALRKIPKHMADILRRQCMHRWKRTVFDEERVLEEFTPQMRRQVVNFINEDGLPQVPYFQALINSELYGDFTTELSIRLKPASAQQGEDITRRGEYGGDLYILQSGHVELKDHNGHRTHIHDKGCFNELELLHEFLVGGLLEYQKTAKAESNCELLILRRQDFQEVWDELVKENENEETTHPIRRILEEETKGAFVHMYQHRRTHRPDGSFLRKIPLFLIDELDPANERPGSPSELPAEEADDGSAARDEVARAPMQGVRRYKAEALQLEIPQDDGLGLPPGAQRRPSGVTEGTDTSKEPSFRKLLSAESPSRLESSRLLSGGVEEELLDVVDKIARVVKAQNSMLERYRMHAASANPDEAAGVPEITRNNGSNDWHKAEAMSMTVRESSGSKMLPLLTRPTSTA